jgi:hypothetical protein
MQNLFKNSTREIPNCHHLFLILLTIRLYSMANLQNISVTDTELIQNFYKMFEKREIELLRNQLPPSL